MINPEEITTRFVRDPAELLDDMPEHTDAGRDELVRAIDQGEVIMAEVNARPVGYLRFKGITGNAPSVEYVLVRPEFRGQGLGRCLLERLQQFLHESGKKMVWGFASEGNTVFQDWFTAMGFEQVGISPVFDAQPGSGETGNTKDAEEGNQILFRKKL